MELIVKTGDKVLMKSALCEYIFVALEDSAPGSKSAYGMITDVVKVPEDNAIIRPGLTTWFGLSQAKLYIEDEYTHYDELFQALDKLEHGR